MAPLSVSVATTHISATRAAKGLHSVILNSSGTRQIWSILGWVIVPALRMASKRESPVVLGFASRNGKVASVQDADAYPSKIASHLALFSIPTFEFSLK